MPEGHRARIGTLVLVVGPSGAGKDTLLALARERLSGDGRFVFPRRVVTRPSGAHEDHDTLDQRAFAEGAAAGSFMLHWDAHGLRYAIPSAALGDLEAGRSVVVNVSRSATGAAQALWPRCKAVMVTAPAEVLAARLATRGREAGDEARARLRREGAAIAPGIDTMVIVNDGPPEAAAEALVGVLLATQTADLPQRVQAADVVKGR